MSEAPLVSIIVNYFNPGGNERVSAMLNFVLESVGANTEHPLELIVADGSGKKFTDIAAKCEERGWKYIYSRQKEGFAETYNKGMQAATGDYRVWMASDIIVSRGWEKRLISELERTGAWMAAPYLTSSDYQGQVYNWVMKMMTFFPSSMTFNLNMITKECYEIIGLMDEQFSGCFNDIDYLIRIRRAGGQAIIVNAGDILHVSRGTISAGTTMVNGGLDQKRFLEKYPELASLVADWQYDYVAPVFCRSWAYRMLIRACHASRNKNISVRAARVMMRLEPLFHRCYGKHIKESL